jgi:Glycosyl transferase family 2
MTPRRRKPSKGERSGNKIHSPRRVFNRSQFLQLVLESVEAQSYTSFEVVIVDDGSTNQDAKE